MNVIITESRYLGYAKGSVGFMYGTGKGVTKNEQKEYKWYKQAAKSGSASAQYNLGMIYREGKVVNKNWNESMKWYRKAAEQNHPWAQNNLGSIYENGRGVEVDVEKAAMWYAKAAALGNALAQKNIADMYKDGKGVNMNWIEALQWYFKAALNGERSAILYLQTLSSLLELRCINDLLKPTTIDIKDRIVYQFLATPIPLSVYHLIYDNDDNNDDHHSNGDVQSSTSNNKLKISQSPNQTPRINSTDLHYQFGVENEVGNQTDDTVVVKGGENVFVYFHLMYMYIVGLNVKPEMSEAVYYAVKILQYHPPPSPHDIQNHPNININEIRTLKALTILLLHFFKTTNTIPELPEEVPSKIDLKCSLTNSQTSSLLSLSVSETSTIYLPIPTSDHYQEFDQISDDCFKLFLVLHRFNNSPTYNSNNGLILCLLGYFWELNLLDHSNYMEICVEYYKLAAKKPNFFIKDKSLQSLRRVNPSFKDFRFSSLLRHLSEENKLYNSTSRNPVPPSPIPKPADTSSDNSTNYIIDNYYNFNDNDNDIDDDFDKGFENDEKVGYNNGLHYTMNDEMFHNQILELSVSDELDVILNQKPLFPEAIEIDLIDIIKWCKHIRALIQGRTYEYPLIHDDFKIDRSSSSSSPFTSLKSIISKHKKKLKVLQKHKGVLQFHRNFLSNLSKYLIDIYSQYILLYDECGTTNSSSISLNLDLSRSTPTPTLIHYSNEGSRILLPEYSSKLLPGKGFDLVSDEGQGSHPVVCVNGVHFKSVTDGLVTIAPGIEYMVDRLNKIVVGHGSSPTSLVKITNHQSRIIYQASKTVKGIDLQYILEEQSELLQYLDLENYSGLTIMGILTNPQDGKADNYMVEIDVSNVGNGSGNNGDDNGDDQIVQAIYIVGIDNDMAFGESVQKRTLRDSKNSQMILLSDVRNVLFLFPQMNAQFSPHVRNRILKHSAEMIMIRWLLTLEDRNKEYFHLSSQLIFSQHEMKLMQLPIRLSQNLVRNLYRKFLLIQQYLRDNESFSHHDLLMYLEPVIAEYYKKIRDSEDDIISGIHRVYNTTLGEELQSRLHAPLSQSSSSLSTSSPSFIRNSHHQHDFHTLASRVIYDTRFRIRHDISISQAFGELILTIHWPSLEALISSQIISALSQCSLSSPTELLHQLISMENITTDLIDLLVSKGAHVRSVAELRGYNILHVAVRSQIPLPIIEYLITLGADVNALDDFGETPLDKLLKVLHAPTSLLDFLLSHDATPSDSFVPILQAILKQS